MVRPPRLTPASTAGGSLRAPLRAYLQSQGFTPRYSETWTDFSARDERRLRRVFNGQPMTAPGGPPAPVAPPIAQPGAGYRKARLVRLSPAPAPRAPGSSRLHWLLTGAVAIALAVLVQRALPFGPQMVLTGDQAAALGVVLVAFGVYLRGRWP